MPGRLRSFFEPRFGQDFGSVRIHTGPEAAEAAQGVRARAFTIGRDVVFGGGEYQPTSARGQRLLAHELTHVVQQQSAGAGRETTIQRDFEGSSPSGDRLRVVTDRFRGGGPVQPQAATMVITSTGDQFQAGDQVQYGFTAEVVQGHQPFTVRAGIYEGDSETILYQRHDTFTGLLRTTPQGRSLTIPAHPEPGPGAAANRFFVRLEHGRTTLVEYTTILMYDTDAVRLARVFSGETGDLRGMLAVAHVILNRLEMEYPSHQYDSSSPWPRNYINTAYLLPGGTGGTAMDRNDVPESWRRPPTAGSREFARCLIAQEGPPGPDITNGAIYYCTSPVERQCTGQHWQRMLRRVEAGYLGIISIGGNDFICCGNEPGVPPGLPLECRRR
jgi:hypothetical protein